MEKENHTIRQYPLRMPEPLHDKIKVRAKNNRRTINNELLFCIEQQLEAEKEKGVTEAATSSRHVQQPQIIDGDRLNER